MELCNYPNPDQTRCYEIKAIEIPIVYNKYGDHDPNGLLYVLKKDAERIRKGALCNFSPEIPQPYEEVKPLVIRANAGDCIEFRFTNLLPERLEESPFQMETLTDIVGHHVHLVKFDTIVSDGAANGWNNIAGARRYETLIERFFANTELRTVFFHDHLFANSHQMHGMFGAMIIEEAGATFHSVRSGRELKRGTQANGSKSPFTICSIPNIPWNILIIPRSLWTLSTSPLCGYP